MEPSLYSTSPSTASKLAIIDDDFIIVSLLKDFLQADENLEVVFANTDGNELLKFIDDTTPEIDILLLDLKMKTIDGFGIIEELRKRQSPIKIIVVSSHYQQSTVGFMTKQGVAAFLPKGTAPHELKRIINHVAIYGFYFDSDQLENIRSNISNKAPQPNIKDDDDLTEREIEVLKLLCQQKSAKEIGEQLFISQRTVEGHKNNLFLKTGAKNVAGLIVYSLQKGISHLDDLKII